MHMPCTCRARAMHMPCTCCARAYATPCVYRACAIPCTVLCRIVCVRPSNVCHLSYAPHTLHMPLRMPSRTPHACPAHVHVHVADSLFGKTTAGYDPVGLDQSDNSVGLEIDTEMESLDKEGELSPATEQDAHEVIDGFKVAPTLELMEGSNGYARA